jgi:hypothetical protein
VVGNNSLHLPLLLVGDVDQRRDHRFGVCVDGVEIVDRGDQRRGCCCSGEFEVACSEEVIVSYYSGAFGVSFSVFPRHQLDMVTLLEVLGVPFLVVVLGVLGFVRIDLGSLDRAHIGRGGLGWEDIELGFRAWSLDLVPLDTAVFVSGLIDLESEVVNQAQEGPGIV